MPGMGKNVSPSTSLEFAFTPNSGRQITRCLGNKHSLELDPHGAVTHPPSYHNPLQQHIQFCQAKHWTHCTPKTSLGIQASALTPPRYFIACLLTLLSCHSTEVLPHMLSPANPPLQGAAVDSTPGARRCAAFCPLAAVSAAVSAAFILISFLLAASPHQEPARRAMTTCTYSSPDRQRPNKCVKKCNFWDFWLCARHLQRRLWWGAGDNPVTW